MESSRTIQALNNAFFGLAGKVTALIGPFLTRIIIYKTIGEEYLGLSGVFGSVFTMLQLTELGFSSAITFKLFEPFAQKDFAVVNSYLLYLKHINRMVGIVILTTGIAVTPILKYIVRDSLPPSVNMYSIYYILLINTVVSYFLFAYKNVILVVSQRQDIESRLAAVVNAVSYIIQISTLILFHNYYLYLIIFPIATIGLNIARSVISDKIFPECRAEGLVKESDRYEIRQKLLKLAGHRILGTVILSADNIVISYFLGIHMVARYNNYYMIINALISVIAVFDQAVRPGIGNSMVTETVQKNYKDFKNLSFLLIWITGWMTITWTCLIQDFITIVFGQKYMFEMSTVLLLSAEFYLWKSMDIIAYYRDVIGAWEGDAAIPYISALFNLMSNIILVKVIGINGVVLSTFLSFLLFTVPFGLKVLVMDIFQESVGGFMKSYFKHTFTLLITGAGIYFFNSIVFQEISFVNFIMKGLICVIIPNIVMIFFYWSKPEFIYIKTRLKFMHNRLKTKE